MRTRPNAGDTSIHQSDLIDDPIPGSGQQHPPHQEHDEDHAAGGAAGQDHAASPGAPGCLESSGSREGDDASGVGGQGAEGEAAGAPQAGQGPQALGPGGDAAPAPPVAAASRLLEFTLTVPFRSPLEADMARRSLAPHAQRHGGVVHKELAVNGSALAVRWTAEDPVFFRISINSFLDQLSLVIRNIRGFGTPPPRSLGPGKRS
ncbi:EKC/KEOPS complex subunit LAGE3-like [Mustela nigripes]|uniref:EKC/KEOPS complex subunit LAGE3-like n=1 Tax=Mustela nigripes TaxID=77151 RepID=UPI00281522DD|nr:EKC/KEOPS complex subunit LAGE3-like [Mustela nigripes]